VLSLEQVEMLPFFVTIDYIGYTNWETLFENCTIKTPLENTKSALTQQNNILPKIIMFYLLLGQRQTLVMLEYFRLQID
jgi:hypothetical protein